MGRQSSRILIEGYDAKQVVVCEPSGASYDIDQIWMNDADNNLMLVWEKLIGNLWEILKINGINALVYDSNFFEGLFMAFVRHIEEDKIYLYTSSDGVEFDTQYIQNLRYLDVENAILYYENGSVYALNSNGSIYEINSGIATALPSRNIRMFGYDISLSWQTSDTDTLFINNENKVYYVRSCKDQYAQKVSEGSTNIELVIRAGYYIFESTDFINWDCINCKIYDTQMYREDTLTHFVYCPIGLKGGNIVKSNECFYMLGELCRLSANVDGSYSLSYENKFAKTTDFQMFSVFYEAENIYNGYLKKSNNIYELYYWDSSLNKGIYLYSKDLYEFHENVIDLFDYSMIDQETVFDGNTVDKPFAGAEGKGRFVFFFGYESGQIQIKIVTTDKNFKIIENEIFTIVYSEYGYFSERGKLIFGNGIYLYMYNSSDSYNPGIRVMRKKEG